MIRIVCIHWHPSNVAPLRSVLAAEGLTATVEYWTSAGSQFSSGYDDGRAGGPDLVSRHTTLRSFLERETSWREGDALVLCTFSAGGWAPRHWLAKDPEAARLIDALVMLDGLHGTSQQIAGVVTFGKLAAREPERKLLVVTNSDIPTQGYPSTSQAARTLLDELGIAGAQRLEDDAGSVPGVHVIEYGGATAGDHSDHQADIAVEVMRRYVTPFLRERLSLPRYTSTQRMAATREGSLGERCLLWCQAQRALEDPPSVATRAKWFRLCERGGKALVGPWTKDAALADWNHCAAAQSAALSVVARAGDVLPHGYRAGARELMADAIERHCWHEVSEVRAGVWEPAVGDLAIYDRSVPGRPETSWWGHVDRVMELQRSSSGRVTSYTNLGANEGADMWREQVTPISHTRLLGFVAYPQANVPEKPHPDHLLSDEQIVHTKALAALALDSALSDALSDPLWKRSVP